MNLVENLLLTAGEEAAELIKAFSKANRFGFTSVDPATEKSAGATIAKEMNDLLAVIELLRDRGIVIQDIGDPLMVGEAKKRFVGQLEVSQKADTLVLSDQDQVERPEGVNSPKAGMPEEEAPEEETEEEAPEEEEEEEEETEEEAPEEEESPEEEEEEEEQ